jgi:hypothetical protein
VIRGRTYRYEVHTYRPVPTFCLYFSVQKGGTARRPMSITQRTRIYQNSILVVFHTISTTIAPAKKGKPFFNALSLQHEPTLDKFTFPHTLGSKAHTTVGPPESYHSGQQSQVDRSLLEATVIISNTYCTRTFACIDPLHTPDWWEKQQTNNHLDASEIAP